MTIDQHPFSGPDLDSKFSNLSTKKVCIFWTPRLTLSIHPFFSILYKFWRDDFLHFDCREKGSWWKIRDSSAFWLHMKKKNTRRRWNWTTGFLWPYGFEVRTPTHRRSSPLLLNLCCEYVYTVTNSSLNFHLWDRSCL